MELTQNPSVLELVRKTAELTTPKEIVWIDGSEAQLESLRKIAVETGELIKLNERRPLRIGLKYAVAARNECVFVLWDVKLKPAVCRAKRKSYAFTVIERIPYGFSRVALGFHGHICEHCSRAAELLKRNQAFARGGRCDFAKTIVERAKLAPDCLSKSMLF